jgi:hypothetical protein
VCHLDVDKNVDFTLVPGNTTIRVSTETHEELRALAAENDTSIAEMLRRMLRHERQRRMAVENANRPLTPEDRAVIASSAATVRRAAGQGPRARR